MHVIRAWLPLSSRVALRPIDRRPTLRRPKQAASRTRARSSFDVRFGRFGRRQSLRSIKSFSVVLEGQVGIS